MFLIEQYHALIFPQSSWGRNEDFFIFLFACYFGARKALSVDYDTCLRKHELIRLTFTQISQYCFQVLNKYFKIARQNVKYMIFVQSSFLGDRGCSHNSKILLFDKLLDI